MPPVRMYVNDVDMSQYGMWAFLPDGWADAPGVADPLVPVPGSAGSILLSTEGAVASRQVILNGMMSAPSGDLVAKWDTVKLILSAPILELRFQDWADRVALARCQRAELKLVGGLSPAYGAMFTCQFLQPNPFHHALAHEAYVCSSLGQIQPVLGTAPSAPRLYLLGTGTNFPAVSYVDAQGSVRGFLQFNLTDGLGATVALNIGDWIMYDGVTLDMVWSKAGVLNNAAPYWNGAGITFALDPHDAALGVGPYLRPIGCNLIAHVRRAYR